MVKLRKGSFATGTPPLFNFNFIVISNASCEQVYIIDYQPKIDKHKPLLFTIELGSKSKILIYLIFSYLLFLSIYLAHAKT